MSPYRLSLSAACLALLSSVAPVLGDDINAVAAGCTRQITAKAGDSCVSVSQANSITVTQFLQINPSVRSCSLTAGASYCVSTEPGAAAPPASGPPVVTSILTTPQVPPSAIPTPIKPSTPAAPSSPVGAVPSSGSSGLIPSPDGSDGICGGQYTCLGSVYGECCSANGYCGNGAEYCGEGCNPAYGQCGICAAASPGSATTTVTAFYTTTSILVSTVTVPAAAVTVTHTVTQAAPAPPTTTKPPGVATPSPTFPGVTKNCQRWYYVRATDTCRRIALTYGTTQAQIVAWNPSFDCDDLEDMAGTYICVGVAQVNTIGLGNPFGGF